MYGYLTAVITTAFFCALINAILPQKGVGRLARSVVAIVMVTVTVFPIVRAVITFSEEMAIPVINEKSTHINDSEEDLKTHRKWLAETAAESLCEEIARSVKDGTGLTVRVECPWHFSGNDVVFDEILLYTDADKRYYDRIENYVKLHFSLECECQKEIK